MAISMLYEEDKQKIAMNPMNRSSRTEVVEEGQEDPELQDPQQNENEREKSGKHLNTSSLSDSRGLLVFFFEVITTKGANFKFNEMSRAHRRSPLMSYVGLL